VQGSGDASAVGKAEHGFIVPDLSGPPTGGTLYDAQLIAALQRAGVRCRRWPHCGGARPTARDADRFWVDSLYLEQLPQLRAELAGAPLMLMLHYLPSLVRLGREVRAAELTPVERNALSRADGYLVPSSFMLGQLALLGLQHNAICVEPGVELPAQLAARVVAPGALRSVMLCNVTEGKGVLPFLAALGERLRHADRCSLEIVGATDREPAYASACRALCDATPALRSAVRFAGGLPHAAAIARLNAADVLVSASRMESYGMALAEARAMGVPVLARAGGHTAAQVEPAAGGRLVHDDAALAEALLDLVRAPAELERRRAAAIATIRHRSWDDAARAFSAQL
jgi:glycosyltransferase involved in cell wall biosynthesis